MEIWINPACSKCRAATAALDESGHEYATRRYLDDPPTVDELTAVLVRLGLEPWDIVRTTETPYAALRALPKDAEHRPQWIDAMITNPILIQRPIITTDNGTTAIARDPETLARLLKPDP